MMSRIPKFINEPLKLPLEYLFSGNKKERDRLIYRWKQVAVEKRDDVWDYQWQFSLISNYVLCIVPKKSQIFNIDYGEKVTHTTNVESEAANIDTEILSFPLKYPSNVIPNKQIDNWHRKKILGDPSSLSKFKKKLKWIIRE